MKHLIAALSLCLTTVPALAHGPYSRTTISVAQADTLMEAAVKEAEARKVALAIIIVDEAGDIVMSRRMDGALPHSFAIALRKAKTSALTRQPTKAVQDAFEKGSHTILAIEDMMPIQGGLPVKYNGKVIGAIAASGSPAAVDEAVVQAGVTALETHITSP